MPDALQNAAVLGHLSASLPPFSLFLLQTRPTLPSPQPTSPHEIATKSSEPRNQSVPSTLPTSPTKLAASLPTINHTALRPLHPVVGRERSECGAALFHRLDWEASRSASVVISEAWRREGPNLVANGLPNVSPTPPRNSQDTRRITQLRRSVRADRLTNVTLPSAPTAPRGPQFPGRTSPRRRQRARRTGPWWRRGQSR